MHVVKTFIYVLDVSYAPTYIFRSNGYLNYNQIETRRLIPNKESNDNEKVKTINRPSY